MLYSAAPLTPVVYTISPIISGTELRAVKVEINLVGDTSGQTVLELPGKFGGVKDHWRYLSNLEVSGAGMEGAEANHSQHQPIACSARAATVVIGSSPPLREVGGGSG